MMDFNLQYNTDIKVDWCNLQMHVLHPQKAGGRAENGHMHEFWQTNKMLNAMLMLNGSSFLHLHVYGLKILKLTCIKVSP